MTVSQPSVIQELRHRSPLVSLEMKDLYSTTYIQVETAVSLISCNEARFI